METLPAYRFQLEINLEAGEGFHGFVITTRLSTLQALAAELIEKLHTLISKYDDLPLIISRLDDFGLDTDETDPCNFIASSLVDLDLILENYYEH